MASTKAAPTTHNTARNANQADAYQKTATRLQGLKNHFQTASSQSLKGKVCIVTGAESLKGIGRVVLTLGCALLTESTGRATVLIFAREGAEHIYVLDKSTKNFTNLATTVRETYPDVKITCIEGDAAKEAAVEAICKRALTDEGRLDIFFANAGMMANTQLQQADPDVFMETMRVNALSCMLAIKHASAAMSVAESARGKAASGGSIILTSSAAGLRSGAVPPDYSASKAAINNLAQTGASHLANSNIRVNSICPGLTETSMTEFTFQYARERGSIAKLGQLNPLGRYAIPEEIAQVALFFASDQSSFVNGQMLAVDGGHSASLPVLPGRWA